ncbi:L-arabinose isomerase [Chryseobacterium bernardetii]|uniref:L-arabinose isomerase n=2 Tax=Chryseobacterium TaxID=59732 RepID=A0A543EIJ6_9FLAO|nr:MULTISPECIES: L-arabinose isomerase [Chryseobacterium]MDR6369833.1 L-arabinose isomerase [Chryseobacterium vietnamense]MDR6440924.1 L-arabinose isomerase [Chryseobacterium bernardetii]TQM21396.1 L-arabinose isomerase [Chryseobacterium aquifrigidense]
MLTPLNTKEVWFITGSQHLYGPETLAQVADHSQKIVAELEKSSFIPVKVIVKPTVKTTEEIFETIAAANQAENCIGIITWMHTFSPAKMWIRGLKILQKPLLHLHTQFNRDIPWSTMDMDFMNLNQAAHGDREFGFMVSRLRKNRKVVVGHWSEERVQRQIGDWSRVAAGWDDWQGAKFARFGDNMRFVAVTDGDKVEAETQFGFSVNTWGIGDLVGVINSVSEGEIKSLMEEYESSYHMAASLLAGGAQRSSLHTAAKIELGLGKFLKEGGFKGFSDTFEDLHGLEQLPGIAVQRLMQKGYGFAGEGDWKTAALVRAMKTMGQDLEGGNAFMEDYTYHLDPSNPSILGSHMLEVDPVLAAGKPSCEIHPLGIGGKADPVRLVFNSRGNIDSLNAALMDFGNHFRLLINKTRALEITEELPKLPVARVLWKPLPDLYTAAEAWILAGGAHHTCYSENISAEQLEDFAEIARIESLVIDEDTRMRDFKNTLRWNEMYYR